MSNKEENKHDTENIALKLEESYSLSMTGRRKRSLRGTVPYDRPRPLPPSHSSQFITRSLRDMTYAVD